MTLSERAITETVAKNFIRGGGVELDSDLLSARKFWRNAVGFPEYAEDPRSFQDCIREYFGNPTPKEQIMSFVKLTVTLVNGTKRKPSKAQRDQDINKAGGLRHNDAAYQEAARKLSKLPWVAHVTATLVQETPVGIWYNGRKS
jgi:hypothetical protein